MSYRIKVTSSATHPYERDIIWNITDGDIKAWKKSKKDGAIYLIKSQPFF